jgi:glycerol kinase
VGFWPSIEALQEQWQVQQKFSPAMEEEERAKLKQGWEKAVRMTIGG